MTLRSCWGLCVTAIVCWTSAVQMEIKPNDLNVKSLAKDQLTLVEILSQVDPKDANATLDVVQDMLEDAEKEKDRLIKRKQTAEEEYEVAKDALDAAKIDEAQAKTHKDDATEEWKHRLPILENEIRSLNTIITIMLGLQARHLAVVGDSTKFERAGEEDSKVPECLEDHAGSSVGENQYGNNIGVQCCSIDGQTGERPDCLQSVDWSSAKSHCEANHMRLCTAAEVTNGIGAHTGCDFDAFLVWTSDECKAA